MHKTIRLFSVFVMLLVINCSDQTAGQLNLDMAAADLSVILTDLSVTPTDLTTAPMDLSLPGPPRLCSPDNWCWENPQPQGNGLYGVWGADPNNVWAVGLFGTILKTN